MARGGDKRERLQRTNLVTGEDTYAGQNAQNPVTSRRLQSLIPSLAGELTRESANPILTSGLDNNPVTWLFEYDNVNGSGVITRYYLMTTGATGTSPNTLWISTNLANWTNVSLPIIPGSTTPYVFICPPQAVVINNLLHVSDGNAVFLFDGTTWVLSGFQIPDIPLSLQAVAPSSVNIVSVVRTAGKVTVTVANAVHASVYTVLVQGVLVISGATDASLNGTFNCTMTGALTFTYNQFGLVDTTSGAAGTVTPAPLTITTNRYYWGAWLDQTAGRGLLQSDVFPISVGTGAVSGFVSGVSDIGLTVRIGGANLNTGSTALIVSDGSLTQKDVGNIFVSTGGTGRILSVSADGHSGILTAPWTGANLAGYAFFIYPPRATHLVIYASESENSKVGFQLMIVPILGALGLSTLFFFADTCPFVDNPVNFFTPIERPVRNDPPIPSKIQTVHKNRIFRRRETSPRFLNFTAFEEVAGNLNGSPQESTPGTDPNTLSDIVNEDPYPDSSVGVRGIVSHGEALYFGSEQNITPLYGQSIDDFTLSQIVAFKVGFAGRYAEVSTPHGLVFVSYDKKVYLYPSQYPAGSFGDSTQYLVELSRPKRTMFENIKSSDLDNVRLVFYNYGRRNWLVLAYQDKQNTYHTWVYDFETQGWFELQRGVASLAVFELPSSGDKILVGGDASNTAKLYILDDLTGTYTTNANLPLGTFRPALIDWGKPGHYHVFRYVEFEVDNVNLGKSSIIVNYYLDPVNVDALGPPSGTLVLSQVRGSNFFRGFAKGGSLCYRMMLEILVTSDTNAGVIRGLNIVADEAASLIF